MPGNELASISPEGCLDFSLSELKQCFYKKKRQNSVPQSGRARIWTDESDRRQKEEGKQIRRTPLTQQCKLDWQFIYWDIKLKKYKQQCDTVSQTPTSEGLSILNQAKQFLESLELRFNTNEETFLLVKKCLESNLYPFKIKPQQKVDFDAFMVKYVIDESYLRDGYRLYSLDEIMCQKRPPLRKFQSKMDTANRRVQKTWDMLGPVDQMADRIGHKYEQILLRQLNEVANVKIFELTEH